jgi:hypothetical protein
VSCGLTLNAVSQTTLIPLPSVWKYNDSGVDQGTLWRNASFDDSSWSNGVAQLGFGDNREATRLRMTNAAGVTNLTFYFRQALNVPDVTVYTNLLLRMHRDDGTVVYLNGVEVFRSNMPQGPISYGTLASTTAADDGTALFASPINPALLVNGNNVLAVEVHQATTNSSDLTFDLVLEANVMFQSPTIAISSPTNGAAIGSADLTIDTTSDDPDGVVSLVEFYANGAQLGAVTNPPFRFVFSNIVVGSYALNAVAVDSTGLATTSAPVVVSVPPRLVPSGSAWKYLDDGSNPGPTWITAAFNDAGWSNGVAQLGFGDGDESTMVRQFLSDGVTQVTTYYFRQKFNLASTAGITNLVLRLIRDDGAVAYLNGTEVFRINMPTGPITSTNFAATVIANDNAFHATRVNPALLVTGQNVLAVEIHQANATSSDISFDLELRQNVPLAPPTVSVVSPGSEDVFYGPTNVWLAVQAGDFDSPITSVNFLVNGVSRGMDTTDTYDADGHNFSLTASNLDAGSYVARVIAIDAGGLQSTSPPVSFTVAYAPVSTTLIATGSVWKYLDTGVDQGTAWHALAFDDSSWPSGTAKFGTNDPATTIIHITPINVNLTAYFRHRFQVNGAASYTNLFFRCLRDDGVVAWLNGTEVFRSNMTNGPVSFSTPAPLAIGSTNENYYVPISTNADALINGENILAVELHQSIGTSDAGFDLGLVGIALPAAISTGLNIQLSSNNVILSWLGTGYRLEEATDVAGPYQTKASGTNYYSFPKASGNRFYRLVKP